MRTKNPHVTLVVLAAMLVLSGWAADTEAAPVAHWTFDATTYDTTGNYNGVANGSPGYSGIVPAALGGGQSIDLNGSSQWVSVDISSAPGGPISGTYTISAWARVRDNSTNTILATRRPSDASFDMKLTGGNLIHGDIGNGSSWMATNADATFYYSQNQWHHIAYVVTPTQVDVYADGVRHGGRGLSGTPLLWDSNHDINIGRYNAGSEYFNGYIDDVAVWNSALTPTQIAALSTGTAPAAVEAVGPATSGHNGAVRFLPITNDADSGISTEKVYTHKVDFGSSGAATVNGVVFDATGPGPLPGGGTSNLPSNHGGNGNHNTTGGVAALFQDMTYNANPGIITLNGLTPGQTYDTRLYVRNWESGSGTNDRSQLVQFDTNADGTYDRALRINPDNASQSAPDFANNHQAYALSYVFRAESEKLTIQLDQLGGGTYHLYGLTNEETSLRPIETVFSTGLDANGDRLADGTPDPHYTLTSAPGGYTTALAIANHPAWTANDDGSGFIGVVDPGTTNVAQGLYVYETTFDLTGHEPNGVELTLTVHADDSASIWLNGVDTGITANGFNYDAGKTFTLNSGFLPGMNTLEFRVNNGGSGLNPSGLRVDISGVSSVPEPATMLAAFAGLAGLGGYLRKRRTM